MKILVDTHTHTNCSSHAYGTLKENIEAAREKGLELLCTTNHAPGLPDAPHLWHFGSLWSLPRESDGVKLMYGAECSILDTAGNLDLPTHALEKMEIVIASIHQPVYTPKTKDEHTLTYLNAVKNPYVDILGHSGSTQFEYDHEPVIRLAKEYGKCVEINNHTFNARSSSVENCIAIAKMCKKVGTKVVVASDAHSPWAVGCFDKAAAMLQDIGFPEELIMNTTASRFISYIECRRRGL